jgi:hypothetical protein
MLFLQLFVFRYTIWPEDDFGRCRLLESLMSSINEVVKTVILVIFIVSTSGFIALSSEWHKTFVPSFMKIGRIVEKFMWGRTLLTLQFIVKVSPARETHEMIGKNSTWIHFVR